MDKIKRYFVRRWLHLLTITELRDEIFRKVIEKWYGDMAATMLDAYFGQEYPLGETKVPGGKIVVGSSKITEEK